jgi:hypothetical protein
MPKASLNSWICFWLKRVKMFDPDFLAFFPFGAYNSRTSRNKWYKTALHA